MAQLRSLSKPLLDGNDAPLVRPNPNVQVWRDRRLRIALVLLRILSLLDGTVLIFCTTWVGYENGLLGYLFDDYESFWGRSLEAFTFVLPMLAGSLLVYSSVTEVRLDLGPAAPAARCALLLVCAGAVTYLRATDRYIHHLGWDTLGRLGELHGLGYAILITLANSVAQLFPPVGVPEVPASAAIVRLAALRQSRGALSAAQAADALPAFACGPAGGKPGPLLGLVGSKAQAAPTEPGAPPPPPASARRPAQPASARAQEEAAATGAHAQACSTCCPRRASPRSSRRRATARRARTASCTRSSRPTSPPSSPTSAAAYARPAAQTPARPPGCRG